MAVVSVVLGGGGRTVVVVATVVVVVVVPVVTVVVSSAVVEETPGSARAVPRETTTDAINPPTSNMSATPHRRHIVEPLFRRPKPSDGCQSLRAQRARRSARTGIVRIPAVFSA